MTTANDTTPTGQGSDASAPGPQHDTSSSSIHDASPTGPRPDTGDDLLARRWVAQGLGVPASRVRLTAVPSATSSALDLVTLDREPGRRSISAGANKVHQPCGADPIVDPTLSGPRFALRRFIRVDWLLREPDLPVREASALALMAEAGSSVVAAHSAEAASTDESVRSEPVGCAIRTPSVVALDVFGVDAGHPAVLMTWLPGQPTEDPDRLAAALAVIHRLPESAWSRVPWTYSPYHAESNLEVPDWTEAPEAWDQVLGRVSHEAAAAIAAAPVTFIHRDYHPDNVLAYSAARGAGSTPAPDTGRADARPPAGTGHDAKAPLAIVDWVNACLGPPGADVAHCRLNLVQTSGWQQADVFAAAYAKRTGYLHAPIWDAIALADTLPGPDHVYPPWRLRLSRPPSLADVRQRLDGHARRVAMALGAS